MHGTQHRLPLPGGLLPQGLERRGPHLLRREVGEILRRARCHYDAHLHRALPGLVGESEAHAAVGQRIGAVGLVGVDAVEQVVIAPAARVAADETALRRAVVEHAEMILVYFLETGRRVEHNHLVHSGGKRETLHCHVARGRQFHPDAVAQRGPVIARTGLLGRFVDTDVLALGVGHQRHVAAAA